MTSDTTTATFTLCHSSGEIAEIWELNTENPYAEALKRIDYRVEFADENAVDSDDIKIFHLID